MVIPHFALVTILSISFKNILNRAGDNLLSCRVPRCTSTLQLYRPFHLTTAFNFLYQLYKEETSDRSGFYPRV